MSDRLNGTLLTQSNFVASLLDLATGHRDGSEDVEPVIAKSELPFVRRMDPAVLMRVRRDEGEAFQSFRRELHRRLADVRLIEDPVQLKMRVGTIEKELTEDLVPDVRQKLIALRSSILGSTALALAGLTASIEHPGRATVLSAAVGAWKTVESYRAERANHPGYFLWRVLPKRKASRVH